MHFLHARRGARPRREKEEEEAKCGRDTGLERFLPRRLTLFAPIVQSPFKPRGAGLLHASFKHKNTTRNLIAKFITVLILEEKSALSVDPSYLTVRLCILFGARLVPGESEERRRGRRKKRKTGAEETQIGSV